MKLHRYVLDIQEGGLGEHPIIVVIKRHDEETAIGGKSLKTVLRHVVRYIIAEEEKEA